MKYSSETIKIRSTKILYVALLICITFGIISFVMHFLQNKPFHGVEFYFKLSFFVGIGVVSCIFFVIKSYFSIELTDQRIRCLHILRVGDEVFYTDIAKIEASIEYTKGIYAIPQFYLKIYRIFDEIPIKINITFLTDKQKRDLLLLLAKVVPEVNDPTGITKELKQGNVKRYHRKMNTLTIFSAGIIIMLLLIRFVFFK